MSRTADRYFRNLAAQQGEAEKAKQQRYDEVWNNYMSEYANLGNLVNSRNTGLDNAFNSYYSTLSDSTNKFTGTLSDLAAKLASPESKMSFGIQGSDPITVTSKSAREDTSTLSDLASKIFSANVNQAGQKYTDDQRKANSVMDYYNALLQAAQPQQGGDQNGVVNAYSNLRSVIGDKYDEKAKKLKYYGDLYNTTMSGINTLLGNTTTQAGPQGTTTTSNGGTLSSIMGLFGML